MRPFLIRILLFLAIQATGLVALLAGYRPDPQSFYASIHDKHVAARSAESPKLLIVGGSNALFAFDSSALEAARGRPTVNLALHAALGYQTVLSEAESFASPGDTVLISIAYGTAQHVSPSSGYQVLEQYPAYSRQMGIADAPPMLDGLWSHMGRMLRRRVTYLRTGEQVETDPLYNLANFDRHGDLLIPANLPPPATLSGQGTLVAADFLPGYADDIGRLSRRLADKGVTLIYVPPAVAERMYRENAVAIQEIHDAIEDAGVTCLLKPEELVYPDAAFHDTVYHPRPALRSRYTDTVITALAAYPSGVAAPARQSSPDSR